MTPSEFKTELKRLRGGYLFYGEEDYLKRHYLSAARKETVSEGDVFNHIIINSENYSPVYLSSAIEALPVMADKKLIEINSLYYSSMSENDLEQFCTVLSTLPDYEYNILIVYTEPDELDIGRKNAPSAELTKLSEVLKPVLFDSQTPAKLADWTYKHFVKELIIAPHDLVVMLVDRCGGDMFTLSNEINKLCCYLKAQGRDKLTYEDVCRVCAERRDAAEFEFTNAILDGSTDRAFAVLNDMKKSKEKPEIILSGISKVIGDLLIIKNLQSDGSNLDYISKKLSYHSYKVSLYAKSAAKTDISVLKAVNERCYEADLLIKSTSLDAYTVLERLVVEASKR